MGRCTWETVVTDLGVWSCLLCGVRRVKLGVVAVVVLWCSGVLFGWVVVADGCEWRKGDHESDGEDD